jgi:moderate conductance mechanosensitive channel
VLVSLTPSPSSTPGLTPSPSSTDGLSGVLTSAQQRLLGSTDTIKCERDDVTVCGLTFKLTGHKGLGEVLQIILGTPLRLVLIIGIGIAIRRLVHRLIDRLADRIATGRLAASPVPDGSPASHRAGHNLLLITRREARARTIASVLRSVTTALVSVIVGLMVLQELQFSVAPLLASAGVAGVALGFGSQSLVRDVVSGMFMIVEDQYGVGDVVDLGEASGTVEAVGLRITRLRDVNGTVWYVRNGEILRVGNQSQGWSRAVLDVNVGYQEDISRVEAVLLDVAQGLRAEKDYRALTLGEPEVWGVEALTTDGVVVRLVVKARPLQQWTIARELRRRIKIRFDQEGIEMHPAPPTVVMDGEDGGQQTQAATSQGSPAGTAPE